MIGHSNSRLSISNDHAVYSRKVGCLIINSMRVEVLRRQYLYDLFKFDSLNIFVHPSYDSSKINLKHDEVQLQSKRGEMNHSHRICSGLSNMGLLSTCKHIANA